MILGFSISPSFLIDNSINSVSTGICWDRINSQKIIAQARKIYFNYLAHRISKTKPIGVILSKAGGKVVFSRKLLLPNDIFIPLDVFIKK